MMRILTTLPNKIGPKRVKTETIKSKYFTNGHIDLIFIKTLDLQGKTNNSLIEDHVLQKKAEII